MSRHRRYSGAWTIWRAALAALVLVALGAVTAAAAPKYPAKVGYPNSMASTGDSITRAFNTGLIPFTDAVGNSWSTGTTSTVNSHYLRILAANSLIRGKNSNDAKTGAQMSDLSRQVGLVVSQNAEYVTILLGANDACTSTEAAMTPVSTFQAEFQSAMQSLSTGLPNARIFVASIPNIYNLWLILHTRQAARDTWNLGQICQSMLANPGSTSQTDMARRSRVLQRVVAYNQVLAQVCGQYIHCRFDNNAVFNTAFPVSDVSVRDYFHPNVQGQNQLAAGTYAATFDFTDNVAPTTTASTAPVTGGESVTLTATDNVGVAGIEYQLGSSTTWTRYTGPGTVPTGVTLTYRAVDVNGNIEASQSLTP